MPGLRAGSCLRPAPVDIYNAAVVSWNDTIYVVGGIVNGRPSSQVWKLEF